MDRSTELASWVTGKGSWKDKVYINAYYETAFISLNISHSFLYLNLHVCHIEMLKQTTFYKKLQYLRCFCDRGAFLSILLSFKILEFSGVCFFDPELPLFSLEFESAI